MSTPSSTKRKTDESIEEAAVAAAQASMNANTEAEAPEGEEKNVVEAVTDAAPASKRPKTSNDKPPLQPVPAHLDPNNPAHFDHFLFHLLAFRVHNGNFHVSRAKFPTLHAWMQLLKKEYKIYSSQQQQQQGSTSTTSEPIKSKLTDQQVSVLEFYHVPLTSRGDDHWSRFYNLLVQYKQSHGHCLVPRLCEIPGLGDWVTDQRRQKKQKTQGQPTQLTDDREQLLESLGFAWQVRNRPEWENRYEELVEYKKKYGEYVHCFLRVDECMCSVFLLVGYVYLIFPLSLILLLICCSCKVPQHFKPNKALGKWVAKQREQYKLLQKGQHSFLTALRLEKLNAIGFSWQVRAGLDAEVQSALDAAAVAPPPPVPPPALPEPHHPAPTLEDEAAVAAALEQAQKEISEADNAVKEEEGTAFV